METAERHLLPSAILACDGVAAVAFPNVHRTARHGDDDGDLEFAALAPVWRLKGVGSMGAVYMVK